MPVSHPSVTVNCDDWTLVYDKAATIQVRVGSCSVWFGDKPDKEIDASRDGKELSLDRNSEISYNDDAQCWARASQLCKSARLSITAH